MQLSGMCFNSENSSNASAQTVRNPTTFKACLSRHEYPFLDSEEFDRHTMFILFDSSGWIFGIDRGDMHHAYGWPSVTRMRWKTDMGMSSPGKTDAVSVCGRE